MEDKRKMESSFFAPNSAEIVKMYWTFRCKINWMFKL